MRKYQALIDALKAGPTDGPWVLSKREYQQEDGPASVHANVYPETTRSRSICGQKSNRVNGRTEQRVTDLAYIAAANPATIRSLLADLERAEKAIEAIVNSAEAGNAAIIEHLLADARAALSQLKGVQ